MNAEGIPASLPLVRLLQLASPALPIGAYSYSQGLEWIVAEGVVHDAASAENWIGDVMEHVVAPGEAVVLARLLDAAAGDDWSTTERWNAWFRASRETAESRAETEQMGGSLAKLAVELDLVDAPARAALALDRARHVARRLCNRRARLRRATRARAGRLSVVVARKSGARGDEAGAGGPARRTAAAACPRREDSGSRGRGSIHAR